MQRIRLNKSNAKHQWYNLLVNLPSKLELGGKDFKLLLEAFRRKHCFKAEEKFLGLGTATQYNSKLFQPTFTLEPRVSNWFTLTELGKEKLKELEEMLEIEPGSENEINDLIFVNQ